MAQSSSDTWHRISDMIVNKLEVKPPSGRMAWQIILAVVFISLEAFVF